MNGCLRDPWSVGLAGFAGNILSEWFDPDRLMEYCVFALLLIPIVLNSSRGFSVTDNDSRRLSITARVSWMRMSVLHLIFRLGFAMSLASWIQACIGILSPCDCFPPSQWAIDSPFGMPSDKVLVATLLAWHLIPHAITVGVLFPFLIAAGAVATGVNSLGQVLVGMAAALVLHPYLTRTPLALRLFDFVVNLSVGLGMFFYLKGNYPDTSYTSAVMFLRGAVWQLFAITSMLAIFDKKVLSDVYRKGLTSTSVADFDTYIPLGEQISYDNGQAAELTTNVPSSGIDRQSVFLGVLTVFLFIAFAGLETLEPHMNDLLNPHH